jgi:hypothetical protein
MAKLINFKQTERTGILHLYREINEFQKCSQSRVDILQNDKGSLLAESRSICQLLNVHETNDIRQTKIHTAKPVEPKSSAFEVNPDTEKLKRYKSQDSDHIPEELIQAVWQYVLSYVNILVLHEIKKQLPQVWKKSNIVHIHMKGDKTECR